MIRINKKEYAWGDLHTYLYGKKIGGLRGIDYKVKQDKTPLHAAGNYARSVQHGRRDVDGTLTILQSELIALNLSARAAGYADALGLDFDVILVYVANGIVTTDKIIGVSITELPQGLKEGDPNMEIALPFVALDVEYDIL